MGEQRLTCYGTESYGRLQAVMLHKPANSVQNLNAITAAYYLFDQVPDADRYLAEHEEYKQLLQQHGIKVYELSEFVRCNQDRMNVLTSLAYLHDSSVITRRGAVLSKMGYGRAGEEQVVKEALLHLDVPVDYEFAAGDHFEGFLVLSPQTALIACTERHHAASVEKFIPHALTLFDEIIYVDVPKSRRYMHADKVFGKVNENLALAYLPAILEVWQITRDGRREISDFRQFLYERQMEVIPVSAEEQQNWACSFVPLDDHALFHYDIALGAQTKSQLAQRGVKVIEFHPEALLAGGGSLRCLTLMLHRKPRYGCGKC